MKLYGSVASPFVQRVLMAARLKGHDLPVEAPPGGSLQSPEFQAISPMGRVPLLELDDGRHLCESGAIAAYLDETLAGPALMPADPLARAHVRQVISLAMCELGGGMRPMMMCRVFRRMDSADIVASASEQIVKGLDALERVRGEGDLFAAGDAPGLADCVLTPFLGLMRIVSPMTDTGALIDARPGLAGYEAMASKHPVLDRSIVEMRDAFAAMLARAPQPA